MKKFVCSILAFAMFLSLLPGCNSANNPEASTQPSEVATPELEKPPVPKFISDAEICRAVHEDPDYNDYGDLYTETQKFGWINISGRLYYIANTYPAVEWTPDEVVEHYRTCRYSWSPESGYNTDPGAVLHLWNADFTQHFVADTGENWLIIDGVKSRPLNLKTYSMEPENLVQAFQAKEWKVGEIRRSDDFSTTVAVDSKYGFLIYAYHVWNYEHANREVLPAAKFGYTGFNTQPWWREDEANEAVPYAYSSGYSGLEFDGSTYEYERMSVLAYPDIPWDQQDTLLAVRDAKAAMAEANASDGGLYTDAYGRFNNDVHYDAFKRQAQRNSDGLYAVTSNGIQLWRAGILRQTWAIPTDSQTFLSIVVDVDTNESENYAYSQDKFYRLMDDGTAEIIADHVSDATYCTRNSFMGISLQPNGSLSFVGLFWQRTQDSAEIATDVKEARLDKEADIILYTTTGGDTYAVTNGLYYGSDARLYSLLYDDMELELVSLGQKSIASVLEEYDRFCEELGMNRGMLKPTRIFLGLEELEPAPTSGNSI